MSRRIVLLRHGRTAWNFQRRVQGHVDEPLDEVGHAEARAAASWVAGFEPCLLWTSDLVRARVTAEYAAEVLGLPVHVDGRLREFNLGERAGLTWDEYRGQFPEEFAQFRRSDFRLIPGAEQVPDVAKRMCEALNDVAAGLPEGGTALVASHGQAIKAAVLAMTGQPVVLNALGSLPNCSVAVLAETRTAPAGWSLAAFALTAPA
ncbi:histidine phosphatase family protein [Nocardioides alcanivorans]|uniref:histidine phosphatase family protein n=1 Tax=Nocardioides alcanivorans TaxID=2897352 RepID=UPI001F2357EB|nr:histidine phosphatase family protein [Nocardioides alcanivorans]